VLADRVVVMTASPATVCGDFTVGLERPRSVEEVRPQPPSSATSTRKSGKRCAIRSRQPEAREPPMSHDVLTEAAKSAPEVEIETEEQILDRVRGNAPPRSAAYLGPARRPCRAVARRLGGHGQPLDRPVSSIRSRR